MAVRKVSATLGEDVVEAIQRLAGPRGVSAWLDDAAREKLARERRKSDLLAWLAEMDAKDPISNAVRSDAEEWYRKTFELN